MEVASSTACSPEGGEAISKDSDTDAPAPFPMGDPRNDYYVGAGTTKPGFAPDTRILMKFTVETATSADPPLSITTSTDLSGGLDPFLIPPAVAVRPVAEAYPNSAPRR